MYENDIVQVMCILVSCFQDSTFSLKICSIKIPRKQDDTEVRIIHLNQTYFPNQISRRFYYTKVQICIWLSKLSIYVPKPNVLLN